MINEAKRIVERSDVPSNLLNDDRIMTIDQVMYDNAYLYEPIGKKMVSGRDSPRKHQYQ